MHFVVYMSTSEYRTSEYRKHLKPNLWSWVFKWLDHLIIGLVFKWQI
jgi:hypothetical protein